VTRLFGALFSAHINAMDLKILVGTKKMCMFHDPAGFWPNIFVHTFLEPLKKSLSGFEMYPIADTSS
jgi:hypothetical protein